MSDADEVHIAAQIMDRRKPSWWRRIVFRRLDMADTCNCIGGQTGIPWEDLQDEFDELRPCSLLSPFAAEEAREYWINEVRERRASPDTLKAGTYDAAKWTVPF